jgi:hypothetical protein
MSLLKSIIEAQGGKVLKQLGQQFGLDPADAGKAIGSLLPSITGGMKKNARSDDGLEGLLGALKKGNHGRYLEEPSLFERKETVDDGNGILGHIFGSKARSREVAAQASKQTGLDVSILKKLLPMVAAMTMGGLKKQADEPETDLGGLLKRIGQGKQVREQRQSSGLDSILGGLLDVDKDGSMLDDVMGMAKKFL